MKVYKVINSNFKYFIIFVLACLSFNVAFAAAQLDDQKINLIEIEGNQRVEKDTLLSYLNLHAGDIYSEKEGSASAKKLFATGLFEDVDIKIAGGKLVVKVIENPMINSISFEGNKRIKREIFASEMQLKPRMVFSKVKLQHDVNKLVDIYNKSGRYAINIEPKMIKLDNNRVNLVFEINEGPKTTVKRIYFVGNKKVTDNKLRSIVSTKESKWYNFLSSGDNYDSDRVDFDKELLRRFYNSEGYADFKVISATAEMTPEREAFVLTFSVDEGNRYNFGDIDIENKLAKIDKTKLLNQLLTKKDNIYNLDKVEDSIDLLTKYLNENSYAFVNIEPEYQRDTAKRLISIKYIIEEGRKAYLNRLNITGNNRTKDKVIRREFRLAEGDAFNATLVDRSEQRIRNLDYFSKVDVTKTVSDSEDKIDVNIDVKEKSTTKLNFGAGITTEDKKITPIGQISFMEDNWLGTGKQFGASMQMAPRKKDFEISFTDPYFLNHEFQVGFDLFRQSSDKRRNNPYDVFSAGGVLRGGYDVNEYLKHYVRYTIKKDNIKHIDDDASSFIKEQQGRYTLSSIGQSFIQDKTDNRMRPTKGYWLKFDQEIAGLGGNARFFRNELNSRNYFPLKKDDFVFSIAGNVGHIYGLGKEVRINERFFIGDVGSYGLRGFTSGGIGPRSKSNRNEPLGGKFYYTTTAALNVPLGLPAEFDISGAFFLDAGSVFGVDIGRNNKNAIYDDRSLRASAGFGVVWITRMGPIRLDIPYPILKKKYDQTQKYHITFSTDF